MLVNMATLSWSVGDLIMGGLGLILLVMVWNYKNGLVRREWIWFMCAVLVNLVADTTYNLSPQATASGSLMTVFLNSMWVSAYFLFTGYFLQMRRELERLQTKLGEHGK